MVTRASQYYYPGVANQLSCSLFLRMQVCRPALRSSASAPSRWTLRSAKNPCSLLRPTSFPTHTEVNASNQRPTTTQPPPASVLRRPEPKLYLPSQSQRPPRLCLLVCANCESPKGPENQKGPRSSPKDHSRRWGPAATNWSCTLS